MSVKFESMGRTIDRTVAGGAGGPHFVMWMVEAYQVIMLTGAEELDIEPRCDGESHAEWGKRLDEKIALQLEAREEYLSSLDPNRKRVRMIEGRTTKRITMPQPRDIIIDDPLGVSPVEDIMADVVQAFERLALAVRPVSIGMHREGEGWFRLTDEPDHPKAKYWYNLAKIRPIKGFIPPKKLSSIKTSPHRWGNRPREHRQRKQQTKRI
jgi:hypothetical protein